MEDKPLKLLKDHVVTRCRNGRCYYDRQVKQALIRYAATSGASIPALARAHGITSSQLRGWVKKYLTKRNEQRPAGAVPHTSPFVPAMLTTATPDAPASQQSLSVRLPNGIEIDLAHTDAVSLSSLLEVLWRLPCSASNRT